MAFIKKTGKHWTVRHGVTGKLISRHGSREAAERKVRALHRKYRPKPAHRGKAAKRALGRR